MTEMQENDDFLRPRMHPVNRMRWRTGSSGRPLTPRRGTAVGLLERSARQAPGEPAGPSATDLLVADSARYRAQQRLGEAGRRASWTAWRTDRLAARAAVLRRRAAEVRTGLVRGRSGAAESEPERVERHQRLAATVTASLDRGEGRHRRPSGGARFAARLLPWIDALLFGYFVAGVSNADLVRPWTTPVASLVTVAFTAFLVLTVAVFTPWLGHDLRAHKSASGHVRFADIGPVSTGLLTVWGLLVTAIAVTMFVRVRTEAGYAGADPWAATVVAVLLALAAVAMTGFVLVVAVADGSPETDELDALGRGLARTDARSRRLGRRAHRCDLRRVRAVRSAGRRAARALVRAGGELAGTERIVDLVRLRTGAPADRPRPPVRSVDELDHRELAAARGDLGVAPFE